MIKIVSTQNVFIITVDDKTPFICIKGTGSARGDIVRVLAEDATTRQEFSGNFDIFEVNGKVCTSSLEVLSLLSEINFFKFGGGVTPPQPPTPPKEGEFRTHPDWWDIEKIFKEDKDPNKRFILLLNDSLPTFVFDADNLGGGEGTYYKTSDGATYIEFGTHYWDIEKDKLCSNGYSTRWVMVYSTSKNITCNVANETNRNCLYVYFGNGCIVNNLTFGSNYLGKSNVLLKYITFGDCSLKSLNNYAYVNCYSLQTINMFYGSNTIHWIPQNTVSVNVKEGFIFNSFVDLEDSYILSPSGFYRMIDNLGYHEEGLTIQIVREVYNRLSYETKVLATQRNITISLAN